MNSIMNLARIGLMASAFVATCAMAHAQEPHPRIWLSPAVKARLQDARTANTPEWAALKSWCDARLGTDLPELYNYLEWYTTTMNFALAYQISGDPAYGNEGVKYLTALLRDRDTIGDGLGGTNAVHMDSGYVSRSLGTGVSIGRDWLDGAPNLTPAIIAECTARMGEWYTWIQRPETYGIGEPQTNYHAGHFTMTYTASIAFEGDPGYQMAWQTKAEEMWADVRDLLNTEGQGGDFGEGWNYGPWAVREYLGYPWALDTGTTRPDHWDEIDFASQLARAHVSMLHPSREYFSDDGRWSGDNKGDPRSTVCRMISVLPDTDATGKGLAVWFANNLEWQPGGPDRWEAFLYTDHSIAAITPSPATVGGLTWKGYGHAVARGADWSDQQATFVDVIAWKHLSEEHNFGEIKIASRQELLLTDGQTWQLEAEFANVPRINGTHTYAPYQEVWHEASSLDVDSVDSVYTYFKMDNMENAYDGVNDDDPSCSYFRRDAVFVAPDHVVVFDNIVSTTLANTVAEQWHVMGNPVLAGDTATVTGTAAKMFLRTMTPAVTLSETDTDATREGTFRVDAVPVTPVIANHVVTLFETADATQPSMTPAEVLSPSGMTGIHVQDTTAPAIVLFATTPDAALTSAAFSFVPTSSSTRVVVVGVAPSTGFDVAITDGSGGAKDVSLTPGSTFTSAANGSITFTTAAPPSAVSTWTEYD